MIVWDKTVELADLEKHCSSADAFLQFCDSIVPEGYRHIVQLLNNQRYYCALLLRKSERVNWDKKKAIIKAVMDDICVIGYSDVVMAVDEIFTYVDFERLKIYCGGHNKGKWVERC